MKVEEVPKILAELAEVEMHCIQTSGNCIRNISADHFAGASADEIIDPRPYAEILLQWSSLHPEFSLLPRKFKLALIGAPKDRAAIQVHDIGLEVKRNAAGELGFAVWVGGGQGRTPMIAKKVRDFLPEADLIAYIEAILRIYNQQGRRDNKFKARIKILVHEMGEEEIRAAIEKEFTAIDKTNMVLPRDAVERIERYFAPPPFDTRFNGAPAFERAREIGDLKIKISGCINACGHHHVGHIGILGVDRKGEEFYQITLGGSGDETCSIGEIVGKGFSSEGVVDAVETIVDTYLKLRESRDENFLAAYRRVGEAPFQEALYAHAA